MEGVILILFIFFLWVLPSLLVALTGRNKNLGYWGVFFISIFFSPVVGLICGVASSPKEKKQQPAAKNYTCGKCGLDFTGRPANCPHCDAKIDYPDTVYNCTKCGKPFKGKRDHCPHCNTKMNYGKTPLPEKQEPKTQSKPSRNDFSGGDLLTVMLGIVFIICLGYAIFDLFNK